MKKLHELLRLISARFINENEAQQEQGLQRKEPCMTSDPTCIHQGLSSRGVVNEPADAARKLWCRAQHF